MLLEVLQEFFITDQRLFHSLIECFQVLLIRLKSLPDGLIYKMGKRSLRMHSLYS
jgi:hypothetical protein